MENWVYDVFFFYCPFKKHPTRYKRKAQMYCVLHLSINLSVSVFSALSEHVVSEGTDIQLFS